MLGAPYGNRTRVSALRGPRPRPLDEGSVAVEIALMARHRKRVCGPQYRHCEARSAEAIQGPPRLDCFVADAPRNDEASLLRPEPQAAGLPQRLEIVNADLALAADVQGDDDTAVADGRGDHMRAFR